MTAMDGTGSTEDKHAELVTRAQRGDERALTELINDVMPGVRRYCRAWLGTMPNATLVVEDVIQEIFAAVTVAIPRFRPDRAPFAAFVRGIAHNKVMDARRTFARSRVTLIAEPPESVAQEPGPEHTALRHEQGDALWRLLDVLSPYQREVLTLRVILEMSADEAATMLGTTPVSVRVTQHRALKKLRAHLAGSSRKGRLVRELAAVT